MIPFKSKYISTKFNWANYVIIAVCSLVFYWETQSGWPSVEPYVFNPKSFSGVLSAIFLHADLTHLLGNMLVLMVFGKAIVDKIGNVLYLVLFVAMGIMGNVTYGLFNAQPAIGASGAISGVLAMSLMLMPFVEIKTIVWILPPIVMDISAFWIAGIWFIFDLTNLSKSDSAIAYHAHIGGFIAGLIISVVLLLIGKVTYALDEKSFIELFFGMKVGKRTTEEEKCKACGSTIFTHDKNCVRCGRNLTTKYKNRVSY